MINYTYYSQLEGMLELCELITFDSFVSRYCKPRPEWQSEEDGCTRASKNNCRRCIINWLREEREE